LTKIVTFPEMIIMYKLKHDPEDDDIGPPLWFPN